MITAKSVLTNMVLVSLHAANIYYCSIIVLYLNGHEYIVL